MLLHVWQTLVAMRTGEQLHILCTGASCLGARTDAGQGSLQGHVAGASSVALAAHTEFTHDERKRVEGAYFVHKQRKGGTEEERGRERERERTLLANNKEEEKDVLCARQLTFSHFPLAAGHVAREREKGKGEGERGAAMGRGS